MGRLDARPMSAPGDACARWIRDGRRRRHARRRHGPPNAMPLRSSPRRPAPRQSDPRRPRHGPAKSLSTYGYPRATAPTLQRVASEGAVFERALAPAPWTLPSQATMFTGRQPHEHGADWSKPLDSRYPTLAEALPRAAIDSRVRGEHAERHPLPRTRARVHSFRRFAGLGRPPGAQHVDRPPDRRPGSLRHWLNYHEVADRQPAERITTNFLTWVRANRERPFFAFLNYFDAHDPYLPPDPFSTSPDHVAVPRLASGTPESHRGRWTGENCLLSKDRRRSRI